MSDILSLPTDRNQLVPQVNTIPEPRNPYDSSIWAEGLRKFIANRTYDRRGKLINLTLENPAVKKLQDALQNRQFEAARSVSKVIGLRLLYGSTATGVASPEFDLPEAAAVFDAEPYVRAAITRQLNIWFKQDFGFMSEDTRLAAYIDKRFLDMAFVTGIPTRMLFKMVVRDLLKYSNAFLIKYRNASLSGIAKVKSGRPTPIAGYFPVSALNMYPRFDDGKLVSWIRYISQSSSRHDTTLVELDPRDVVHFKMDLEPDFLFGKPRILGAIEDIAALRRIEENVEVLLVKYLFPLFQFTVGTEESPAQYLPDGSSEIDVARAMIQEMNQEGMLIGTERHKLEVVGAKNQAMDARHYLDHFKSRVFAALGVSPLDLGEGDTANRATADNISQNLKERVLDDQREFASQVSQFIFSELLLEHPDDLSAVQNHNKVRIHFPEVDLDNKIKNENHAINLWNNDGITEDEFRAAIGKMPIKTDAERSKMRFSLIDLPLALISAVDEPFSKEAKAAVKARTAAEQALGSGGGSGSAPKNNQPAKPGTGAKSPGKPPGAKRPGTPKSRGPQNISTPTNQFGTNPAPTKRKSSMERELLGERLSNFVGRATIVDTVEELENIIKERFTDNNLQTILKETINNIDWNTIDRAHRRSILVSELLVHADHFKEDEAVGNNIND